MKFKDTRRGFMKFLPSKIVLCRRKKRERRKSLTGNSTRVAVDDSRCACCLKPFLIGRGVECRDCGVRSCRKVCSHRDVAENTWHCLFCHQRRSWLGRNEEWFETFGGVFSEDELNRYFNTAESSVCVQEVEDNESPRLDLDLAMGGQKEQEENSMEAVRDFIEQIVRSLVGDVNDAPIDRLYNHPAYKPSTDSPTMAHMALRELVERAVEEARKLPGLGGSREVTEKSSQDERNSIVEHSYEDLLATAILNKVIEKFQNERVDGNSNVLHEMPSSRTKCGLNENEFGLDEGVDEGSSSLEPLSQDECSSDCSVSRSRYFRSHQEPLSLTIEERIEEVTTTYTSDEDLPNGKNQLLNIRRSRRVPFPEFGMDIVDPSQESSEDSQDELDGSSTGMMDLITPSESWEENWLFQRKKTGAKADSVAMLVPHPSAEFKALIGDKDAEDTSDLSECSAQSDEEIEKELMEAIQNVIPRSPKQAPEGHDFYNDDDDNNDDNENADHQAMIELQNLLASPREELENHDDKFESKEKPVVPGLQGVDQSFCSTDKVNLLVQSEKLKSSKHRENLEVEVEVFLPKTEEEEDSMIIERNFTEDEYTRHHAVPMYISYNEDSEMPTATAMTKNPDHEDVKGSTITTTAVEGLSNRESSKSRDPAELYKPVVTTSNAKETPKDEKNSLNLLATPPRPGTIAEREHKKWENAVPIENNPYSEENIQRRLLERQYARRSSDISNSHAEPPKNASITNNDPVDIILESNRPDIKRFSRDYYINNAKVSSGDRSQRSPLTVSSSCSGSSSSRPSSSLSQESGSDLERQVSFDLESFEEAYLRDNPSRRNCYRDPQISTNFAINPLLHHHERQSKTLNEEELPIIPTNNTTEWQSINNWDLNLEYDLPSRTLPEDQDQPHADTLFKKNPFQNVIINPIYDHESESISRQTGSTPIDRDSGLYSIESTESRNTPEPPSTTIHPVNLPIVSDQITWVNGKRYWNGVGGWKYHTFGGIKRKTSLTVTRDDLEDEAVGPLPDKSDSFEEAAADFAKFKFQTFGGIKRSKKVDSKRIPVYRKIKLRPSIDHLNKTSPSSSGGSKVLGRRSGKIKSSAYYKKFHNHCSNYENLHDDEPPVVPEIIDRNWNNFKYLRKRDRKIAKSSLSSKTSSFSGVKSLSNITIW